MVRERSDQEVAGAGTHPASFRDPEGQILLRDGRVYRQLSPAAADLFATLAADGRLARLFQEFRLIKTEIVELEPTDPHFDRRGLRHASLLVQTYPWEWSFEMRREAAIATADLLHGALSMGLNIKDGTAFNLTFDRGRMVWIDALSVTPLKPRDFWIGYRQFCQTQLFPLLIESYTGVDMRPWLRGAIHGIPAREAAAVLGWRRALRPGVLKHVLLQAFLADRADRTSPLEGGRPTQAGLSPAFLAASARSYASLARKLRSPRRHTSWVEYASANTYSEDEVSRKDRAVREFLSACRPTRLIDLGCNTGVYTDIAAEYADIVLAVDSDSDSIDRLVRSRCAESLRKIVPIVADLMSPSAGHGWRGIESEPLIHRLRADAFLALALVHHLCIAQNLPISMFVDLLADVAPRGIVEWVGKEDPMVQVLLRNREDIFPGYTEDAFAQALGTRFMINKRILLQSKTRSLYLLEARKA